MTWWQKFKRWEDGFVERVVIFANPQAHAIRELTAVVQTDLEARLERVRIERDQMEATMRRHRTALATLYIEGLLVPAPSESFTHALAQAKFLLEQQP